MVLDESRSTNSEDLLPFLADYGCQENCGCDLNDDDQVDALGLLSFLSTFIEDSE